jgi:uncharacterized C2H2 Zn-finger protein
VIFPSRTKPWPSKSDHCLLVIRCGMVHPVLLNYLSHGNVAVGWLTYRCNSIVA